MVCPRCDRAPYAAHGEAHCFTHGPISLPPTVPRPSARTVRPWTAEEWEYTLAHLRDQTIYQIANHLRRTVRSVERRLAKSDGAPKPHPPRALSPSISPRHGQPWTPEEDALLLDSLRPGGVRFVSSNMGRSERAICKRVFEVLKLKTRDADGYLSLSAIAREYECPRWRVMHLVQSGHLPAKRANGSRYWRIDPGDAERIHAMLSAPKLTHRDAPPDVGDWAKRYGYTYRRIDGKRRWEACQ